MKLVIDVDGVLADFVLGITKKMSEMNSNVKPFPTSEQKSWDFRELPPGLLKEAFAEAAVDNAYSFNADLESLITEEEARRLTRLSLDHEVYFATNRPGGMEALRGTKRFLDRIGMIHPNVVITAKKGEFAAAIGATHLIDDKAGNAVYAKYHSPSTEVFLIDRPYNRFDQTVVGTKVNRIMTFSEFLDAVEKS